MAQNWSPPPTAILGTSFAAIAPSTQYLPIFAGAAGGNNEGSGIEALVSMTMPRPGTVQNLYVKLRSAQPAGGTLIFTVMKNGVATGITVTFAAGAIAGTIASDLTHSATYAKGDTISVQITNNSAVGQSANGYVSMEYAA